MSLIQEALKRQHEDLGSTGKPPAADGKAPSLKLKTTDAPGHAPAESAAAPAQPIAAKEPEAPAAHTGSSVHVTAQLPKIPVAPPGKSKLPIIIAGVVVIVVLLVVGIWLVIGMLKPVVQKPQPPAVVAPVAVVPSNKPPAVVAPVVQPATQAVVVVQPVVQPSTQVVVQVAVSPSITTSTPVAVVPAVVPVVPAVVTAKPPPVVVAPVVWPPLKINMLLKTARTAVVRINNSEYSVGDEVEGVKVVAIEMDSVTLKYKNETRKLRAGEVTK